MTIYNSLKIYSERGKKLVEIEGEKEGEFSLEAPYDTTYTICFIPTDTKKKYVSFDFGVPDENLGDITATSEKVGEAYEEIKSLN